MQIEMLNQRISELNDKLNKKNNNENTDKTDDKNDDKINKLKSDYNNIISKIMKLKILLIIL